MLVSSSSARGSLHRRCPGPHARRRVASAWASGDARRRAGDRPLRLLNHRRVPGGSARAGAASAVKSPAARDRSAGGSAIDRSRRFEEFVREHLPAPPATGARGRLRPGRADDALAAAGYDVLGIDPLAPLGDRFRRIRLEDLEPEEGPFDAVVAVQVAAPHPRSRPCARPDRRAAGPGGCCCWTSSAGTCVDEATLDWLYGQRRALAAAGHGEAPGARSRRCARSGRRSTSASTVSRRCGARCRRALRGAATSRWTPFLHRLLGGVATEVLEQALIDAGAIRALGFRYAGRRALEEGLRLTRIGDPGRRRRGLVPGRKSSR